MSTSNKTKTVFYWASTGLVAAGFAFGGLADLARSPQVVEGMTTLGYPAYVAIILGFWKLAGAATILAPRLPRLKEWAYAGILFDLTGAAASHAFAGDATGKVVTPLVLLAVAIASWALRPTSRRLGDVLPTPASLRRPVAELA